MAIVVDDSERPILVVTLPSRGTDADVADFIAANRKELDAQARHLIVVDMSSLEGMSRAHRDEIRGFIRTEAARLRLYRIGTAFVLSSMLNRGVISAIYLVQPPPYRYRIVGTLDEAMVWARSLCLPELARADER